VENFSLKTEGTMLRRQPVREYWYISGTTIQFISSHTVHGILAEKSSWDHANRQQKLGLVWRNRTKISQIINDYLYFYGIHPCNIPIVNYLYLQISFPHWVSRF
jgi:hypothetical protein